MQRRLIGLETEYALRYSPHPLDRDQPGNRDLFLAFAAAIRQLVHTLPSHNQRERDKFFTLNGGAFCYEAMPTSPQGGLLEGATPECRGPRQLLLYQRAQDDLLRRALPLAQQELLQHGWHGDLGVLKNCRDAQGHIYGAQENFEATIASGPTLWAWRALVALLPLLLLLPILISWAIQLVLIALLLLAAIALLTALALRPSLSRHPRVAPLLQERGWRDHLEPKLGRLTVWIHYIFWWPALLPFLQGLRALAFRPQRAAMTAFLASRATLSGCGFLTPEGRFELSEKGAALRHTMRATASPSSRSIYDTGNLMKFASDLAMLRTNSYRALFAQRQRMQLGLADSNVAQVAELLKIGATLLVLEMAEAGALADAPRLADPVAATRAISADPDLQVAVRLRGGASMTALELQRFYQRRAADFVQRQPAPRLEDREIVQLWADTLDALERDPALLVGRLDWVTKRFLLRSCAEDASQEVRKKIDLRYHELGQGYLAQMEQEGLAVTLLTPEQLIEAAQEPPDDSPAALRSHLMKTFWDTRADASISWDEVRIGGPLQGKVIRLSDYRRP
jgi:hypothetical protein